jgi:predicted AAA+ superfamily ATPase
MMIYRYVSDEIEEWLTSRRPNCLVLRGARQVGKTTAIRSLPSVRGGETGL